MNRHAESDILTHHGYKTIIEHICRSTGDRRNIAMRQDIHAAGVQPAEMAIFKEPETMRCGKEGMA